MRKRIFGKNFEELVDYVEAERQIVYTVNDIDVEQADGIFVVYDHSGAQLVFGDGKMLTRED